MEELHQTHPGVSRMKSLAISYVWWPSVDADLEAKVKNCHSCRLNQRAPAKAPSIRGSILQVHGVDCMWTLRVLSCETCS